ncbi:response regulator transcription factor [bacterium SCSIO 12643]|nr:response regulator transcription factor [bacterium SCSIO 12643]
MARTKISVLTEDKWLEEKTAYEIQKSEYAVGFIGVSESHLLNYLKKNTIYNHILLIKPTPENQMAFSETFLRSLCKINVIIIGGPLADEHKAIIQSSHISGYLTLKDIHATTIKEMVFQINKLGYFPNDHIPIRYWINSPKKTQELVQPKFTNKEKLILFHMCHGFTNVEIAEIIKSSISNVRNHVERMKAKAQVQTNIEMVAVSVSNNWIQLCRENFKRHNPYIMKLTR